MNRYYNPLGPALTEADRSLSKSFAGLADSKLRAAEFTEKQAEKEYMRPILEMEVKKAKNYIDEQKHLDQPVQFQDIFGNLNEYKDHEKIHLLSNDIPGSVLQSLGATFNEDDKKIYIGDKVVTRRMASRHSGLISGVIDAKTAARKVVEDNYNFLMEKREQGQPLSPDEMREFSVFENMMGDPHQEGFLDLYDAKEQRLLALKGRISDLGGDTAVIDESLARVSRKRKETLDMIMFNKQLNQQLQLTRAKQGSKPLFNFKDVSSMYKMHLDNLIKGFEKQQAGQLEGFKPILDPRTGEAMSLEDYMPTLQKQTQLSLSEQFSAILPLFGINVPKGAIPNKGKGLRAEDIDPSIREEVDKIISKARPVGSDNPSLNKAVQKELGKYDINIKSKKKQKKKSKKKQTVIDKWLEKEFDISGKEKRAQDVRNLIEIQ